MPLVCPVTRNAGSTPCCAKRSRPGPDACRYVRRHAAPACSISASAPISTPPLVKTRRLVAEGQRPERGLLDTSVLIDLDQIDAARLPITVAVSALSMAELAAGPHATSDADERGRRQDRLQRAEATFDPLPFDGDAARAYGRVFVSVMAAGPKARGARAVDLLIAANSAFGRTPSLHPQRRRLPRRRTTRRGRRRVAPAAIRFSRGNAVLAYRGSSHDRIPRSRGPISTRARSWLFRAGRWLAAHVVRRAIRIHDARLRPWARGAGADSR